MKTKTFFLTLLALGICIGAMQAQTVVYGSLGIGNVNISVKKSTYGTSTDAKGNYTLRLYEKSRHVDLLYSCIGYYDTIINLSPTQLRHDSLQISFRMRKKDYQLQEVGVSVEMPPRLEDGRYFIMDFEMYNGTLCLLEASHNRKQFRLILTDENLYSLDTIPIPTGIKPENLQRDCMGNCQLIATDSVYQIDLSNKPHRFISALKSYYLRVMKGCLFATDQHIYVKESLMQGYLAYFYRIDRNTQSFQTLFTSDMTENIDKYQDEMTLYMKMWYSTPKPHGAPPGVWSRHIKNHWFRPSDAELALAKDTLVYFDHSLGFIIRYGLDVNKIDSCAISYPFMEGWKPLLYQDPAKNHFYTIIKDRLFEIDTKTGKVSARTKLNANLFNKILVYNGHLFVLRRMTDSSGKLRSYIERRAI